MSPLAKILLAVVLFVPGGLVFAPFLWLERRWQHQRRTRVEPRSNGSAQTA